MLRVSGCAPGLSCAPGHLVRGWRSPGCGLASCTVGWQLGSCGSPDQVRATALFGAVQAKFRPTIGWVSPKVLCQSEGSLDRVDRHRIWCGGGSFGIKRENGEREIGKEREKER